MIKNKTLFHWLSCQREKSVSLATQIQIHSNMCTPVCFKFSILCIYFSLCHLLHKFQKLGTNLVKWHPIYLYWKFLNQTSSPHRIEIAFFLFTYMYFLQFCCLFWNTVLFLRTKFYYPLFFRASITNRVPLCFLWNFLAFVISLM